MSDLSALMAGNSGQVVDSASALQPETVSDVIAIFLRHEKRGVRSRAAVERERRLRLFADLHGTLPLAKAKPWHLLLWLDGHPEWVSDWTISGVVSNIRRPFAWAAKLGLIDRDPFYGVAHRPGKNGRAMELGEFQSLLRRTDACFRRVLIFLKYTAARPGEMAALTWPMIDLARGVAMLSDHKTSRTQRQAKPRLIVLHPVIVKLLRWIARREPGHAFVFRNAKGGHWKRYAVCTRMKRLRKRLGLSSDCKLYGTRHAGATEAVRRGTDIKTVAEWLGHTTTRTTERYIHIAGDVSHLHAAVQRIFPVNQCK